MKRYCFTQTEQELLEGLATPFAVYQFVDKRVVTLALSDGFCTLFGFKNKRDAYVLMDQDMYQGTHPDDIARIADASFRFATDDGSYDVVYRSKVSGSPDWHVIHAVGKHVYTESGVRLAQVAYTDEGVYDPEWREHTGARDGDGDTGTLPASESVQLEQNLVFSSMMEDPAIQKSGSYDYLTGLPSMTYFFELAESGREAIQREGGQAVLLYFDLGGMKFFNTRYGFSEGDQLLRSFAKILTDVFSSENCGHISADHFAVFTKADNIENTIHRLFHEWHGANGGRVLPVHVGIYLDNLDRIPVNVACDRAKIACDEISSSYTDRFDYYSQKLGDDAERRQYILENLNRAIQEHWIQVYYQPIVRAVIGRVCDEEALARWIDPRNGFMSPADFIPALEEAGAIYKLDLFVLDRVLEKIHMQASKGLYVVPQSINLSRSDFEKCDMVEEIRNRVDNAGVPRELITIEITESIIGSNFEYMKEQIRRFQELGFHVWMDDFGSGYSSLDVLQSIHFDLIKFDMSFMKRLEEGDGCKIILTELVKMANGLGVDTVCEGVETEKQVRFLQEIGCSKLQGYYFNKPVPMETILERYAKGIQIGFENPDESEYYETIGRANLFDIGVIANEDDASLQNYFDTLPMGIMEIQSGRVRFVRSNQSYRDFMTRFFRFDLSDKLSDYTSSPFGRGSAFMKLVRIGVNPVTGATAVAIAVLSITDEPEGATYAGIARALAADYYNLYYVDLKTEDFIEYSSPVGEEELAVERHGKHFFDSAKRDTMTRIYEEDREAFISGFTKDNVIRELNEHGVFTRTYRLIDGGKPIYVSMKVMRMQTDRDHIIIGISIIDSPMKQKEAETKARQERIVLGRIAALSGRYLSLYLIDPETNKYIEFSATQDYERLGIEKSGEDFFRLGIQNGRRTVYPEDLPKYLQFFSKDKMLEGIREQGVFSLNYRLVINDEPVHVNLRAAMFQENGTDQLIVGVIRKDRTHRLQIKDA